MKTPPKRTFFRGVLIFVFLFCFTSALLGRGGPGQTSFEKAYRIEKTNPKLAVEYYKKALSFGLNRELRKAAKWRLFYLYKDLGLYDEAMRLARELGASKQVRGMERNLVKELADRLGIDTKTAKFYIKATDLAAKRTQGPLPVSDLESALAKYPKNENLIRTFVRASLYSQNRDEATEVFAKCPTMLCHLAEARLLLEEDLDEAQELLKKISYKSSLTSFEKSQILYLWARFYREDGKIEKAVDYYRLAANYAQGQKAIYYRALAAFALYEIGYKKQARALFGEGSHPESFHLNLLDLILRVDLDQERGAYEELRRLHTKIEARKKQGHSLRLMEAVLRVLDKGVPN